MEEDWDAVVVAGEDELVADPVAEEETELVAELELADELELVAELELVDELVVGPILKMNASPGKA